MIGSFHIALFESTLHVDKIHVWFKIANITHALPVPVYRQTDFTPKRVVVSRLHDTVARFRTWVSGVEFLPRYNNPGWTQAGVTRAGMTFCGGIMWTNIEEWEGTGVISSVRKSPLSHVNAPLDLPQTVLKLARLKCKQTPQYWKWRMLMSRDCKR